MKNIELKFKMLENGLQNISIKIESITYILSCTMFKEDDEKYFEIPLFFRQFKESPKFDAFPTQNENTNFHGVLNGIQTMLYNAV